MRMKRDKILVDKDRVQKKLWEEAGSTVAGYVALVHRKADALRRAGLKIRYAQQ